MNVFFRIVLITFISIVFSNTLYSQIDTNYNVSKSVVKYDTTKIIDLSDKLLLWPYIISKNYQIGILNMNTDRDLLIYPNEQTNIGLGFNYKWLGLGIALKTPWINNDDNIYGKTERIDLQINIFSRSFGVDFSAQYYKGFYVSNPTDFLNWEKPEYPRLSNLETFSTAVSTYYFFNNKNFSYRAAFVRNEIQKKMAGSVVLGVYMGYDVAVSPNGFVPDDMPDNIKDTFDIVGFASARVGISVGYTYTFVFLKDFFINLSIVPGMGIKVANVYTKLENKFEPESKASFRAITRFALGYENKNFYVGISNININNSFNARRFNILTSSNKFRLYVGKRFNIHKK
jgi:hypothetical protein